MNNKQEVIEKIKALRGCTTFVPETRWIRRDEVLNIIDQLNEPQKPVVPKYVADWYEKNKDDFEIKLFGYSTNWKDSVTNKFKKWFASNDTTFQTLVNMHQFGYETITEKLYTVEFPNYFDVAKNHFVLYRDMGDRVVMKEFGSTPRWKNLPECQLTEKEIKKNYEWAWDLGFAKEVVENVNK